MPQITSAKLTTVPRQTKVNFTFTATGIPAPQLTLTGTLPKGLVFTPGGGHREADRHGERGRDVPADADGDLVGRHDASELHVARDRTGARFAGLGAAGELEGDREVGRRRCCTVASR